MAPLTAAPVIICMKIISWILKRPSSSNQPGRCPDFGTLQMNPGQFYVCPKSPQPLKQLLMVSGYDRYYQIVKCFRDEDRGPTASPVYTNRLPKCVLWNRKISWTCLKDWLIKRILKMLEKNIDYRNRAAGWHGKTPCGPTATMGPDIRFGMGVAEPEISGPHLPLRKYCRADRRWFCGVQWCRNRWSPSEPGCSEYSRKQTDELTEWVKRSANRYEGNGVYQMQYDKAPWKIYISWFRG